MIADRVGAPPSSVMVARGRRSRDKVLEVEGVDQAAANAAPGI
jgi:uncharacterized protein YggU (UPF0235/DUF167 family)